MAAVIPIVTQLDVDQAWEAYQDLVVEAIERPKLFGASAHRGRMERAHRRFVRSVCKFGGGQ